MKWAFGENFLVALNTQDATLLDECGRRLRLGVDYIKESTKLMYEVMEAQR